MLTDSEWAALGRKMRLTRREVQVLRGVCDEQDNAVIGRTLGISPRTVRTHLERVYRKCGCTNRTGAVVSVFRTFLQSNHRATSIGEKVHA